MIDASEEVGKGIRRTKSPVVRATIDRVTVCGDDVVLHLRDVEDHAATFTASIKLPATATGPLAAQRWWSAMAAVWGEAKNRSASGAYVDLEAFLGRRVRAVKHYVAVGAEEYDGWDFEPQADFDVKTKAFLAAVWAALKRTLRR